MCPHEEKVTAWLLGDLSPQEHQEMSRHLEGCAACRAVRGEIEATVILLRRGLEKDRQVSLPSGAPRPRPAVLDRFQMAVWGRRAALFVISCGALFTLVAVFQSYRGGQSVGPVTHITFRRETGEPLPELLPAPEGINEPTPDLADFKPELPAEAMGADTRLHEPSLPTQIPEMPHLPTLRKAPDILLTKKNEVAAPWSVAGSTDKRRKGMPEGYEEHQNKGVLYGSRLTYPYGTFLVRPFVMGAVKPDENSQTNMLSITNDQSSGSIGMPTSGRR